MVLRIRWGTTHLESRSAASNRSCDSTVGVFAALRRIEYCQCAAESPSIRSITDEALVIGNSMMVKAVPRIVMATSE